MRPDISWTVECQWRNLASDDVTARQLIKPSPVGRGCARHNLTSDLLFFPIDTFPLCAYKTNRMVAITTQQVSPSLITTLTVVNRNDARR